MVRRDIELPDEWVSYLRKSQGRAGIGRQRDAVEGHVKRLGGRIVREFVDTDATAFARPGEARPVRDNYAAMLGYLQSRGAERVGVLAWHVDRLHRGEEVNEFIAVCSKRAIPVETVRSGGYDLTTATGRKRLRADAVDAEYEVDHMIERIEAMKLESVQQGRWLGGRVPYGWSLERPGCDLVLHPVEAPAIAWGCEAVLRGVNSSEIGREWDRRGFRRKNGDPWDTTEVRRLLLRPRNAGLMEHRGRIVETELDGGGAAWPPIVSEETWKAVKSVFDAPGRRTTPGPDRRWLGSGLYRCGVCEGPLLASSAGNGRASRPDGRSHHPAYRCRASGRRHVVRNAEVLDGYVQTVLVERLSRPDVMELITARDPVDLGPLRTRLVVLQAELEEWRHLAGTGEVTPIAFARAEGGTLERIEQVRSELAAAQTSPVMAELATIGDIEAHWASQPLGWRRTVLDLFVTVTVHRGGKKGRPAGWRPGDPYFRPECIEFAWKCPS